MGFDLSMLYKSDKKIGSLNRKLNRNKDGFVLQYGRKEFNED